MKPLFINQSSRPMPKKFLEQWLKVCGVLLHKKTRRSLARKELVLVFVDAAEMRRVNHQYRGGDYATDVLSFAPVEENALGELILCPQVILKQGMQSGLSEKQELAYMTLHGILHLMGYDHEKNAKQAQRMFDLQNEVFFAAASKMKWKIKATSLVRA